MVTFDDIRSRISYDLSEMASITFTDDELFQYAIEGSRLLYRVIVTVAPAFLLSRVGGRLVEGMADVVLPADVLTIYELVVKSLHGTTHTLTHTNLSSVISKQHIASIPICWTRISGGIQVSPVPDAAYDYVIYYVPKYVAPIKKSDSLGIPDAFVDFVVEYAIIRAHNRNDRQTLVEQSFLNLKLDSIKSVVNTESEHVVINPSSYYCNGDAW